MVSLVRGIFILLLILVKVSESSGQNDFWDHLDQDLRKLLDYLGSYLPEIEPSKLALIVPYPLPPQYHLIYHQSLDQLETGDVIVLTSSWGWQTYAVISDKEHGMEKVICFVDRNGQPVLNDAAFIGISGLRLKEVDLKQLSTENSFTIIKQSTSDDKLITLYRAHFRLSQQKEWSFFKFNSGHFASYALTERSENHQLTQLLKSIMKNIITGGETGRAAYKYVAKQLVQNAVEKVIKEATEESLSTLAKLIKGAKAGAKVGLWPSLVVESIFLSRKLMNLYEQRENDEISEEQYKHQLVSDIAGSSGSVAGSIAGAAVGSAVFPVAGTIVGSMVGGMVGEALGIMVGTKIGEGFF